MDENYSYDYGSNAKAVSATLEVKDATLECDFETKKHKDATLKCDFGTKDESEIIQLIKENPSIIQSELQKKTGISLGTIKRIFPKLQEKGILVRVGGKRFGKWIIKMKIISNKK